MASEYDIELDLAEVIVELRHNLLRATDRAIGAEVELEWVRAMVGKNRRKLAKQKTTIDELTTERNQLRTELAAVKASTTWRVGRALVVPGRRLRLRRGGR